MNDRSMQAECRSSAKLPTCCQHESDNHVRLHRVRHLSARFESYDHSFRPPALLVRQVRLLLSLRLSGLISDLPRQSAVVPPAAKCAARSNPRSSRSESMTRFTRCFAVTSFLVRAMVSPCIVNIPQHRHDARLTLEADHFPNAPQHETDHNDR